MANGNEKFAETGIDHEMGDKLLHRTVRSDPAVVSGENANFTIPNLNNSNPSNLLVYWSLDIATETA